MNSNSEFGIVGEKERTLLAQPGDLYSHVLKNVIREGHASENAFGLALSVLQGLQKFMRFFHDPPNFRIEPSTLTYYYKNIMLIIEYNRI